MSTPHPAVTSHILKRTYFNEFQSNPSLHYLRLPCCWNNNTANDVPRQFTAKSRVPRVSPVLFSFSLNLENSAVHALVVTRSCRQCPQCCRKILRLFYVIYRHVKCKRTYRTFGVRVLKFHQGRKLEVADYATK